MLNRKLYTPQTNYLDSIIQAPTIMRLVITVNVRVIMTRWDFENLDITTKLLITEKIDHETIEDIEAFA